MRLPVRIVEVLVKHQNRARDDPIGKILKDGDRRRIEIAVDMQERGRAGMLGNKRRE